MPNQGRFRLAGFSRNRVAKFLISVSEMASRRSNVDSDSKSSEISYSSKLSAEDAAPSPESPSSSNSTGSTPPISPSTSAPSGSPPPTISPPPSSSPPPSPPPPSSSPPSSSPPPSPPPSSSSPPPSSPPPLPPQSSPLPPSSPPPEQSPPPSSLPSPSSPPPESPSPPPQSQSPPPPDQSSPPPSAPPTPPSSPPLSQNSPTPLIPGSPNNSSATGNSPPPPPTVVSPAVATVPPNTPSSPPPPRVWAPPPLPQSPSTTSSSGSSTGSMPRLSSRDSSSGGDLHNYIGYVVAGVFGFILLAILIVFAVRRKRKGKVAHATHFGAANNQYNKPGTEGFYYAQQSGSANYSQEGYYTSQALTSPNNRTGNHAGAVQHFGSPDSPWNGQISFSYEQIMEMTQRFSSENILGEGGFGCVHKGWLSDGKEVAVKQLKAGSGQGEREFRAEVEIISRVHHRHLVSLVGYCIADHRRVLIYEFLPNKTLEYHLHARGVKVLDWDMRMKIAIGSAKGLAYLHEDCIPKIIHRDIKSANILLDNAFEAKVADFGLARLHDDANTHVSTRVMGTFGYLAPEYATSGKLTDRSDVFSFGVVLLELITGRKPVDQTRPLGEESLVEWARPLLPRAIETRDFSELADKRLNMQFVESEMSSMIEAAAACVRYSAPKRPRMIQVVRALDSRNGSCDLSNGVKYGQSTIYDSGNYSVDAIMKFRKMGMDGCSESEFDRDSRESSSPVELSGQQHSWLKGASSGELESRAFNARRT